MPKARENASDNPRLISLLNLIGRESARVFWTIQRVTQSRQKTDPRLLSTINWKFLSYKKPKRAKVKKSKKPGNVREARENVIDEDSMSPCMFLNCDPKSFFLLPRIVIDGVNLPSSPNKDSPSGLENSSFGFGSQRLPSTRDHIPIEQFQPMILYRIQQWSWIKNKHEIWVLSSVKLNQTLLWLLNKLNLKDVGPKSVSEQLLTYPSPDSKLTLTCY